MLLLSKKHEWLGNVRGDLLAGIVVALSLISEAIALAVIVGVDPKVVLYASFCMSTVVAIVGGRPGMISAASVAMVFLMTDLVKTHGLQYLLLTTMLTGVIQIAAGYLKLGELVRFVSRAVVTGFINALAILMFLSQLSALYEGFTWNMLGMTMVGLVILYMFSRIFSRAEKIIPASLVCILLLTAASLVLQFDIRTVGDMGDGNMGERPYALPVFLWPDVPLNYQTLIIVLPYSLALAAVGLLVSMINSTKVDDLTDTKTDRNRECKGQGIANILSGLMGGMAGCALLGQSVMNIKSGGSGRLSGLTAGIMVLMMVVFLNDWVAKIPMAALIAVMIMVAYETFEWSSLKNLQKHPLSTNIVMIITVIVVVWTNNLALGVFVGVLLASLFFANKVSHFMYVSSHYNELRDRRTYAVIGQVFFTSAEKFAASFDFKEVVSEVIIDLRRAHFWDISAVSALDKVIIKFRREGADVKTYGLNKASETIVDRFGIHRKPEEIEKILRGNRH